MDNSWKVVLCERELVSWMDAAADSGVPPRERIPHLREFRKLRRENPHLEDEEVWRLAGWKPSGVMPLWAENGSGKGKAAVYRRDPREARKPQAKE